MLVICCVDDAMGMLFNHRRQSRDRAVRAAVKALAEGRPLWMNAYSAAQFPAGELPDGALVDEDFLNKAQPEAFCFVENTDITPYLDKITAVVLFRWNRAYPSDVKFPFPLSAPWRLSCKEDFAGYSHEKITKEVYTREKDC